MVLLAVTVLGKMMAQALEQAGVPFEYVRYRTGAHGIGMAKGTECESWFERAVYFWNRQVETDLTKV